MSGTISFASLTVIISSSQVFFHLEAQALKMTFSTVQTTSVSKANETEREVGEKICKNLKTRSYQSCFVIQMTIP